MADLEAYVAQMLGPYEEKIQMYQQQVRDLEERLQIYQTGPQITRDEMLAMEQKLRNEADTNAQLTRNYHEMESKYNAMVSKVQSMENQIQRQNQDMNTGVLGMKQKDDLIVNLQAQNKKLGEQLGNQKTSMLGIVEEKRMLQDMIAKLTRQNDELGMAIEDLLKQNKVATDALIERSNELSNLQQQFSDYRNKSKKSNKNGDDQFFGKPTEPGKPKGKDQEETNQTMTSFEPENDELRKQIDELKDRIRWLEREEERAEQYKIMVEKQQKDFDLLKKECSEKEAVILEFNHAKSDLIQQVETYRRRIEEKASDHEQEVVDTRKKLEYYQEKYKIAYKRVEDLEKLLEQQSNDMNSLREKVEGFENGTYGLAQAVSEMRELRAMVDVRDQHIAELVTQVNTMDKIMVGLSKHVDPKFNMAQFLNDFDQQTFDEERMRTERAARDLENKIRLIKERGPVGEIQIEIEGDQRPLRTIIVNDDDNPKMSHAAQAYRRRRRGESLEGSVVVPESEKHKRGRKQYKPHKNDKTTVIEVDRQKGGSSNYKEAETQATDRLEFPPMTQPIHLSGDERDEWVQKLRYDYLELQKENSDLRNQIQNMRNQVADLAMDNNSLKSHIDQMNEEVESAHKNGRSPQFKNIPVSPPKLQASASVGVPAALRTDLTGRAIQCKLDRKKELEVQRYSVSYEQTKRIPLTLWNGADKAIISPNPNEEEVFRAKQNRLKTDLDETTKKEAAYRRELEDANNQLQQQKDNIEKLTETIDQLKQQMQDQLEKHKESLAALRNESHIYAENRVKEELEKYQVSHPRFASEKGVDDLAQVSRHIADLNEEKERLEEKLQEAIEASNLARLQANSYKQRVKQLEAEKDEMTVQMSKTSYATDLQNYNAEVNMKLRSLQKRYKALKDQYDELNHAKPGRNDPQRLNRTDHAIDSDSDATIDVAREPSQIRSAKAKIMSLKTQNEEMQLKLGRANGTIERLNQLLQRKEGQLTKLQEQTSQFKQQIIAKQKEVNSLRAKLQKHAGG